MGKVELCSGEMKIVKKNFLLKNIFNLFRTGHLGWVICFDTATSANPFH
jgi:hypothetical protein